MTRQQSLGSRVYDWFYPKCDITGERFLAINDMTHKLEMLKAVGEYREEYNSIRNLSPEGLNRLFTRKCDHLGSPMNVLQNKVNKLVLLKEVSQYRPEYAEYRYLSPEGWQRLIDRKCTVCSAEMTILDNYRTKLIGSLKSCGLPTIDYDGTEHICRACFDKLRPPTCEVCGRGYLTRENCAPRYNSSEDMQKWRPLDSSSPGGFKHLCRTCFEGSLARLSDLVTADRQFLGFVRSASVPHRGIVKDLGEVTCDSMACESQESVKRLMKIEAVRRGANAVTEFWYEKHHEEETYEAGRGPAGNPYYRTRHLIWYSGRGRAVYVVSVE